jgi:hypothetical protein
MKHTVTDLNDANEPVMFNHSILGNFCFETFFGEVGRRNLYIHGFKLIV